MKYVNAEDVLPPDLLREVQQHYTGYVYVSCSREFYAERRRKVMELRRRGLSTAEIAESVHLCRRRVRQIVAEERGNAF
ncbi:MAG: hypothetical protein ACYTKD_28000 [Planctomycetota bacterium]|jgi:DNA-binding NarL/FixJ family response regulator